jgi:hypothetical protein
MTDDNPYAPPEAAVADVSSGELAPALWNPGAATAWSLLFTPVFGAWMQMRNWRALGEPAQAARSRAWAVGSAIFTLAIGIGAVLLPISPAIDRMLNWSGMALLLVWYFANGREQIKYVKDRHGTRYPRMGWAIPLLAAFGILVAYAMTVGVLVYVVESARGGI